MMIEQATENVLKLRRKYAAPAERVFRALTTPDDLKRWFGPPTHEVIDAEVDLRPGGRYRFTMRKKPDGEPFAVAGTYLEVAPNRKLVYTWAWEGSTMSGHQTRVTMELNDLGAESELLLTQEVFANETERAGHQAGWTASFDRLIALVET